MSDRDRPRQVRRQEDGDRGREATRPRDIPAAGWKDVAIRVKDEVKDDRVPLLSAACAFYAFLALFPALIALVSIYGLLVEPSQVEQQLDQLTQLLPAQAADIIGSQLRDVVTSGQGALTVGLAASVLAALWTASSSMQGVMDALTIAYDEHEDRGFLARRGTALALTLGAIVFVVLALGVIVVVPAVLGVVGLGDAAETVMRVARWPLLGAVLVVLLAGLYRYAPDRDSPRWTWVSWGSVIAAVLWLVASIGFSFYVANFGSYNETYGALGAVIVLLMWLFLSAFVVIMGAEINAEIEHQTLRDTTVGPNEPFGERGATAADTVGQPAD